MNKIISVIIATLVAMSFVAVVCASEGVEPIVSVDRNAATSTGGIKTNRRTVNPAEKAAKARTKADHKYLKTKAKTDAKDAATKAAKEKNNADTNAAKAPNTNLKF